jgi:hypothetical protein
MASVVYGQMWNEDLRFIFGHITVDDARKRYVAGPWFGLAVGEGLCTSADDARAAEAAGVSLPVPDFSLDLEAGSSAVRALFYDEQNSITVLHDWRAVEGRLFLKSATFYTYPDGDQHYGQNESLKARSIDFEADGTGQEMIKETLPAGPEGGGRSMRIVEHHGISLDGHYVTIPEFGDWAALGHRDRYLPPPT